MAAEPAAVGYSVPFNVSALLVPYKKHGRLSLRVERLPQQARLSRGTRNNDGSWSLATDELEDLNYLLPQGADRDHTLAIRIISLAGGNTLAVIDFPVSPGAVVNGAAPARTEDAADAQAQALRAQLAEMKAALAARESELVEARRNAEGAEAHSAKHKFEAELSAARTAWKIELDERLADRAAQGALQLQQHRDDWLAEQATRVAELQVQAQQQIAEARAGSQQETRDALLKAEQVWKVAEAARLAAAQAQWQELSARALAEARDEIGAASSKSHDSELKALSEKLSALQVALAEREAALAEADKASAVARERWQHEAQDALAKAESAWRASEAARLSAAQAQWQDNSAKALAEVRGETAAERDQERKSELRALREKLSALQTTLSEREAASAEALKASDATRERMQREAQDALAKAEKAWKAGEAARLALVRAQWQAAAAKSSADARREGGAEHNQDANLQTLQGQVAALQATLAERDAALAEARDQFEAARERRQHEAEGALAKVERDHGAGDAARLAAAEGEWRKKYEGPIADATARYEAAEGVLAQIRIKIKDDGRVNQELASTRAALAARDAELAHLRSRLGHSDEDSSAGGHHAHVGAVVETAALTPGKKSPPYSPAFIASVVAVACLFATMIVFYSNIEALIFGPSRPPVKIAVEAKPIPAVAPAVVEQRRAWLDSDAKLREGPSAEADIVMTLPRGTPAIILEERGEWTRVRVEIGGAKKQTQQAWISRSQLKEASDAHAKPAAPKPKTRTSRRQRAG